MSASNEVEPICCPKFDPAPWDDQIIEWQNVKFVKEKVFTILYMPVNFGSVMVKLDKKMQAAGVNFVGGLCLSDHTSMWKMDLYAAVDKELPGAENVTLSGRFYSRVYEGPFKDTGKWCKDYQKVCSEKGYKIKKMYM